MSFDAGSIISLIPYALFVVVIALTVWIMWLHIRLSRILRGKDAKSLEDTVLNTQRDLNKLMLAHKQTVRAVENHEERILKSIQQVGLVRFNPFKGTSGSNQSFSLALLDEEGSGVVVTSLYSRERVSTFAKPVKNGVSEYELTPEEKQAIARATTQE